MSALLADTHALVWLATGRERRLGREARRRLRAAADGYGLLYVSVVSLVEVAESVRAGRVTLPLGFDAWVEGLLACPGVRAVEVTVAIVRRAHELYAVPERGDRLLVATAIELGCPLLTCDETIQRTGLVRTVW